MFDTFLNQIHSDEAYEVLLEEWKCEVENEEN